MAGTYGEPGKNPFTVKGVSGVLSPVVNAETGVTQIYKQGALNTYQSLGTYNPQTKKFTGDSNLSESELRALSNEDSLKTIRDQAEKTSNKAQQQAGVSPEVASARSKELLNTGKATTPPSGDSTAAASAAAESDIKTQAEGYRDKFPNLKFPEKLSAEHQDVIKFTMVKFRPRNVSNENANLNPVQGRQGKQTSIGSVTLPIPAGISDNNSVTWNSDELDPFKAMGVDIAQSAIFQGIGAGANSAVAAGQNIANNSSDAGAALGNKFVEAATGTSNLLSRTRGAIINPNMELLFQGPSLRPFSFTFKLAARNEEESRIIRSIIRFFKQGMSPIRTEANLFLKAPHTFQIQYLHLGKQHNYLNKFKECALQSFSVNYAPEGQYATFYTGAMVSYEITMQFQELEPVFNNDYGEGSGSSGKDIEIGF
jgi:hypothetical protein